jgi:hypothetical protein
MTVRRLASLLLLLCAATPTLACTPITSVPVTLTAPGTYCLIDDLVAPADGTAITINGDGIAVDLRGHALRGPGALDGQGTGIVVAAHRRDVLVRNGRIVGFRNGVRIVVGLNVVVEDLEIGDVAAGISAVQGSHYSFRRNRVSGADYAGIAVSMSIPILSNPAARTVLISDNEVLGVNATGSPVPDAFGIFTANHAAIIAGNRVTGVRGGSGSTAVRVFTGSLLVDNEFSATTTSAVCTSGTPTTKAIRNVATNGQSGYAYCVGYDNF